ncbi:hypothetical protein PCANC_14163 [Puccinia coronata f. sp. avenae]|uniref:Uncharacterized protein n=1 Tax=Puccinia coronata f. sp. avenae TaxID=200324 RepID=A0A2N5UK48_9BASI|nr:hypothetical protein PCANC_14163 [Puccinia coronata f. sp. avenae]
MDWFDSALRSFARLQVFHITAHSTAPVFLRPFGSWKLEPLVATVIAGPLVENPLIATLQHITKYPQGYFWLGRFACFMSAQRNIVSSLGRSTQTRESSRCVAHETLHTGTRVVMVSPRRASEGGEALRGPPGLRNQEGLH